MSAECIYRCFKLRIGLFICLRNGNIRRNAAGLGKVDSVGREVFVGRDMNSAAIGKLKGYLTASLAGGLLADNGRPIVLLQSGCKKLRCAVGIAVYEHNHFVFEADLIRGLHGLVTLLVDAYKQVALGQNIVKQVDKLSQQAARVIADIEDKRGCTGLDKLLYRLFGIFARARFKVAYLYIAYISV